MDPISPKINGAALHVSQSLELEEDILTICDADSLKKEMEWNCSDTRLEQFKDKLCRLFILYLGQRINELIADIRNRKTALNEAQLQKALTDISVAQLGSITIQFSKKYVGVKSPTDVHLGMAAPDFKWNYADAFAKKIIPRVFSCIKNHPDNDILFIPQEKIVEDISVPMSVPEIP